MVFDETRFLSTKPEDFIFSLDSLFSLIPEEHSLPNSSDDEVSLEKPTLTTLPGSLPSSPRHSADTNPQSTRSSSPPNTLHPEPHSSFSSTQLSISNNSPYSIFSPIPRTLPKINFAPYHSVMDDIDDWITPPLRYLRMTHSTTLHQLRIQLLTKSNPTQAAGCANLLRGFRTILLASSLALPSPALFRQLFTIPAGTQL